MPLKDYMTEAEKELMLIHELIQQKFLEGTVRNDENATWLIKETEVMVARVKEKAGNRKKREERKEQERILKLSLHKADCPTCKTEVVGNIIGEVTNKQGVRFFRKHCPACNTDFNDFIPIDEKDILKWQQNFIAQLTKQHTDGNYAGIMGFNADDLQRMKDDFEAFKISVEQKIKAEQEFEKLMKSFDESLKGFVAELTAIYVNDLSKKSPRPD